MATPINAVLCTLVGAAFWSVLGFALARHLLPRVLALGAAPVIGWAVFSAASLPILSLIGFSTLTMIALAALGLGLAGIVLWRASARAGAPRGPKPWARRPRRRARRLPESRVGGRRPRLRRQSWRSLRCLRCCRNIRNEACVSPRRF